MAKARPAKKRNSYLNEHGQPTGFGVTANTQTYKTTYTTPLNNFTKTKIRKSSGTQYKPVWTPGHVLNPSISSGSKKKKR